jgi:hypothetical protein
MALWTPSGGGSWHNSANWDSGSVSNTIGETASFVFATNSGGNHFIDIFGGINTAISALNVTLTGSTGLVLQGSSADGGLSSILRLDGGAGDAFVTVNTVAGGGAFTLSGAGNNVVQLATRTIFNIVNAGTTATIDASISGLQLVKTGAGTLTLTNNGNGQTETYVEGGSLIASTAASLGGGRVYLSNGSILRTSGSYAGGIRTNGIGGGTLWVPTGDTLTLSSLPLSHLGSGRFTIGSATDQGTVLINGSGFADAGNLAQSMLIAGGIVRTNNMTIGESLFNSGGGIEIRGGARVEDGNILNMQNLVLNNGTVAFNILNITATAIALTVQNGTFEGTAGVNTLTVTVNGNYSLAGASFANWTVGTDQIIMNGDPTNNLILGSSQRDTINGGGGNDKLVGGGGGDTINGEGGNDILQGGATVDTLNGGTEIDKIAGRGGADILRGGGGADVFKFGAVSDSGIGAAADTITDFLTGTDRLNFVQIDTDSGTAGDQAFAYVGTVAFSGIGTAQIRWTTAGADLRVEADVNGDGTADMHIILHGASAQTLTATDFVL